MGRRTPTAEQRRDAAEARRARRAAITEPDLVMEAAAAFLAVRPRSVEETRRRLAHLGYPPGLCDQVVGRLVELGYLDDAVFARAWVESRDRARPRGAIALRHELQGKGIPDETIREALAERAAAAAARIDEGEAAPSSADREAAHRLLERRMPTLRREGDLRRRRQRAYALLARSGFAPDVCGEVAASVAADLADEASDGV